MTSLFYGIGLFRFPICSSIIFLENGLFYPSLLIHLTRTKQKFEFLFPLFLFLQYFLNLVFALPFFSEFRINSSRCINFAKKSYLFIDSFSINNSIFLTIFLPSIFINFMIFFLIKCLVYSHCSIYYPVFKVTCYIPALAVHISHELWNVAKFHIHFLDVLSFCIFLLPKSTFKDSF